MEQTSARLRKTFRYPEEGDENDQADLDEEEQEKLITTLRLKNALQNSTYRLLLLSIPTLCLLPYLRTLNTANPRLRLLSLLSVSSLLSTAYLLYALPPTVTGIPFLDNLVRRSTPKSSVSSRGRTEDQGPVLRYLPYLNLALSGILVLLGFVGNKKVAETGIWYGFAWLPAVVYGIVLLAKWIMGSVDPNEELEGLRYEFKGA